MPVVEPMLGVQVRELRRRAGIPGLAAVRVAASGVQAAAVDGVRRVGGTDAVQISDRFHLGSNTKALTAVLAALAVERGDLTWDARAADLLGPVPDSPTLRQLLTHASGVPAYTEDEEIAAVGRIDGDPTAQRAAFARTALADPPIHAAGTRHAYSNAGYAIAAAMVEAATGGPWEIALRRRIFDPLAIDARIGWPQLHGDDAPAGHRLVDGNHLPHDVATDSYALPIWLRPAGDVSMSITDYGVFLADQLAGLVGSGRLGPASMYRALHEPDPPDGVGDVGYALGWGVRTGAHGPVSMHTGSAETFYAVAVLEPAKDRGMAVLANSSGEEQVAAANGLVKAFLTG